MSSASLIWQDMTVEQKAEAINTVYRQGMTMGGVTRRINGATKESVTAFYRDYRNMVRKCPCGMKLKRKLTDDEIRQIKSLFASGVSIIEISEIIGVNYREIMRVDGVSATERKTVGPRREADRYAIRITDYPDSLTAAAFGDPTPMRRQLMQEGRL